MKQFKTGDRIYYNNQECEFRVMIDDRTALVTMIAGYGSGEDCDYTTLDLPVQVERLSATKVDLDAEFDQKYRTMMKRYEEDRQKIFKEIFDLQAAKNKLVADAKKYGALAEVIDLIEGTFTHAVYEDSYRRGLVTLDELKCSYNERELAVISYRSREKKGFESYVGAYSDDSGSKYRIKLFKSEADAIAYFISKIEEWVRDHSIQYVHLSDINKCGGLDKFSQPVKDEFARREKQAQLKKEQERKDLEAKLAALQNEK